MTSLELEARYEASDIVILDYIVSGVPLTERNFDSIERFFDIMPSSDIIEALVLSTKMRVN